MNLRCRLGLTLCILFYFLFLSTFLRAQTSTSLKDGHTIVTYTDKKGNQQWHYAAGCERMTVMQMEASIFCEKCREKRKKETELKKQQEEFERQKRKEQEGTENQKKINVAAGSNNNSSTKNDYWGSASNKASTNNNSSTNRPTESTGYSSPAKTSINNTINSTTYQGVGKYEKSGSGIIYPVGPGIKRADGNYDVVDKSGNVHIVSPSENQKLIVRQQDKITQANILAQQQKIQDQFRQQEAARQRQSELNRQREAQVSALADQAANTVYQIGTGIANLINEAKERKERERQRQLEIKQREEAAKLKLEQERQFRLNIRNTIFETYKDSPVPISTSKVPFEKLYYFVYAFDSTMIDKEGMKVFLSQAPFEIARYSDGTWPYKKSIVDKAQSISPFKERIVGYYGTLDEAATALTLFEESAYKSNASIQKVVFNYVKGQSVQQSKMNNFWKKPVAKDTLTADSVVAKMKPKDKYW